MRIKSIIIATLTIFIIVNGSFAKDKKRINELKNQLLEKLRPTFVDGSYREHVGVGLKGTNTCQIIIFQFTTEEKENTDLTHEYKLDISNIDKVEFGSIKDNTEGACGIRIYLKKKGSYKYVQQKPYYTKGKRSYHRIILQSSYNRKDMVDAYNILSELVAECK
ncbi:MAG: hypothetical protein MI866_01560 [Bacteroidales bacterium]|nr:hypothetical protein [Bacteroidales bacterium]